MTNTGSFPDVTPVDEWYLDCGMFYNSSKISTVLYTLKGTLLDVIREPVLQWSIGDEISAGAIASLSPNIVKLQVSQSPCARDVAVLAPVFAPGEHTGIVLSITRSAFTSQTRWFNITLSLCALMNEVGIFSCDGISLVDLRLTNCHLFLLTNRGLFISQDLLSSATGPLNYFTLFLPLLSQVNYTVATLWFSSHCASEFSDDYIALISSEGKDANLHSSCVYSQYPFKKWFSCQTCAMNKHHYISFLHDRHQHTALILSRTQKGATDVSVFGLQEGHLKALAKFPPAQLDFEPKGIILLDTHIILYGSEVWMSVDRGATFNHVFSLKEEEVTEVVSCAVSGVLLLLTDKGHMYLMKSVMHKFALLNETLDHQSSLFCDHMGILMVVSLDPTHPIALSYKTINISHLITEYEIGFDGPLALQYRTHQSVLLHEYAQMSSSPSAPHCHFSHNHLGNVIYFSAGGSVMITDLLLTHYQKGFACAVAGNVIEPVGGASLEAEPIQGYHLLVEKEVVEGLYVYLKLSGNDSTEGFNEAHVGKTVVVPGFSSYLITGLDAGRALATPTMPALILPQMTHQAGDWLLFHSSGPGSWGMKEGPCHHTLESLDGLRNDALIRIGVQENLTFTFEGFSANPSLPMKRMKVILTDPFAMRITAKHSRDLINKHILTITAYGDLWKQSASTVTVFIPEASLLCTSSSLTFTLHTVCPEGLSIVFLMPRPISEHDWLHGDPRDESGNKRLFDLPVNYRPPSQEDGSIPTTGNIYNADPSKPMFRQHDSVSQVTGQFKQCEGKVSAEECCCSDNLRLSSLTINSDCRKRVLKLKHPVNDFSITLFLRKVNHPDQSLHSPYFVTVTEVNNRTDWKVTGTNAAPDRLRHYLKETLNMTLYNPEGLHINCYGYELFHFRISGVGPGVVSCDLVEEVQMYVVSDITDILIYVNAFILGALLLCYIQRKVIFRSFLRRRPTVKPATP
ncbi:cation channel sperm-associated auxiliary subunit beta-like [Xyrauchen texanus]|uniref:cation channel sperm-associated auxiliary subunit beta-like n=1 Tax=Xyrauchen texanus TaxID=154827 RepID=UPI0022422869|nr:cation channel sperm-associated auxiliary subunit beta-like [Xyrauchen texanus]